MKVYTISNLGCGLPAWLCKDLNREQEKSLTSHIVAKDYFGTVATVLSLISESKTSILEENVINELVDEMKFLQENYKISKK